MSELAKWDSFYVIVGSAAGALIGLQFVVMTLINERLASRRPEAGAAFATPTIMHFSAVLLLSALVRAPWPSIRIASIVWGLVGFGGVVYTVIVARRMQTQRIYKPVFEDWLCHALLPFVAYATLAGSWLAAFAHAREALFGVGVAALLLLFTGIHNAWDAVTYHVLDDRAGEKSAQRQDESSAAQ